MKRWIPLIILFVVIGIALFVTLKPKQETFTQQSIEQFQNAPKENRVDRQETNERRGKSPEQTPTVNEAYLDFIKRNLISGGPPKDGIPAIDKPLYVTAEESDKFLKDSDLVFGIAEGNFIAAYPQKILYWHEIVNEEINGEKRSVTYCPLTGSIIGYKGKNLGVSGELYNSNLVMYDRATDSLIPQILGTVIDGSTRGEKLETFPVTVTTWKVWKQLHPDTLVLSKQTGFARDYGRNPYPGYDDILQIWFPVAAKSDRFPNKKIVHGIEYGEEAFAISKEEFKVIGEKKIKTKLGELTARYDPLMDTISVRDENGDPVKSFDVYWFAWYAYHPDTQSWNNVRGEIT